MDYTVDDALFYASKSSDLNVSAFRSCRSLHFDSLNFGDLFAVALFRMILKVC